MVIKHPSQRVAVLVDVQNMYHSARHLFGARVNFKALLDAAVAKRQLIRSIAYVVRSGEQEEQTFFDALTKASFEMRMKELQVFHGGMKKADWDVGLTVDAIRLAPSLDALVLVSGDGDFIPLVEYLKMNKGLQVEVMAFAKSSSQRLKETADEFEDLGNSKYLLQIPSNRARRTKSSGTSI